MRAEKKAGESISNMTQELTENPLPTRSTALRDAETI